MAEIHTYFLFLQKGRKIVCCKGDGRLSINSHNTDFPKGRARELRLNILKMLYEAHQGIQT
jgi:hypothetical protein